MHERLPGVIVVPIGHRHTMLDFHKRRIELRPWVDGVSELILLVDHDRNGAGQAAAMACERRWRQAGRDVLQLMPNEPGWDFNDVIMRRHA